jgi:hypothetical protein
LHFPGQKNGVQIWYSSVREIPSKRVGHSGWDMCGGGLHAGHRQCRAAAVLRFRRDASKIRFPTCHRFGSGIERQGKLARANA